MAALNKQAVMSCLAEVMDPEIPVISLLELGVVRDVQFEGQQVVVALTPTYSGCPAMKVMEEDILKRLTENGYKDVRIKPVFSPAWTTDWMSDEAKRKLKEYGIAPPGKVDADMLNPFKTIRRIVTCPFCDSSDTELRSEFGSTACKAMHYCLSCNQPFEHFKCI
ncbi:MAG: 1,2-phenylacetyl-CoA epoxidase subunit PaaD [Calditrichota bacterium]